MIFSQRTSNIDKLREISSQLDKDIVLLHQSPEHGPLLLSWMLMNFQLIELRADNPEFQRFQQYGTKATKLGVFGYLQKMICHPMYRDQSLAANIAYRTVYNLLATMFDIFDSDRAISQHKNIFELLCELLKNPLIAASFHKSKGGQNVCDDDDNNDNSATDTGSTDVGGGGAHALLQNAIDNFPIDFISLSMIATSWSSSNNVATSYVS